MGMTYKEYWDGTPRLAVAYRKAYKLRREVENENAWLAGLYVYDAVAVCMANAFGKKGAKKQNYIERPIDIFPLTEREKKRREQEERVKMQEAMAAMIRAQQRSKQKGD